ncbi:MAG: HupE/UreJ family protein [Gammaproteobacteria bacterium]
MKPPRADRHATRQHARTVVFLLALCSLLIAGLSTARADVVKPALIEISIDARGTYRVEVRASVEALLTGINSRYRNTREAPNAEAYDALRVLQADELQAAFEPFRQRFTQEVQLLFDDQPAPLTVTRVEIPEPGYTKVPRISVIYLEGDIARSVQSVRWYYPQAFGDNAVRVRQVDEANEKWHWSNWQWLRKDEPSEPFSLTEVFTQQPVTSVIATYTAAGFDHILPRGLDHILFILGIFLLSVKLRPLLLQVTMFTVAHTITLGLSMSGIFSLPAFIVEPLIALSIAWIGIENIFARTLHRGRLALVFGFGLLHGMGFASMLKDFGMPDHAFFTALLSFNVGVELGQLAIITLAFLAVGLWFADRAWYRQVVVVSGSLAIAAVGLYWTYDRIMI